MSHSTVMILLACSVLHAQPPSFEVASIKPIPAAGATASPLLEKVDAHPGSVNMSNVRIRTCIKWAYDLKNYEIDGVDRMAPEHYNIMAKADEGTPVPQLRIMMQTLLQSRFGLTFHRETKQLSAFELVVAKSGSKLHPADADGESSIDGKGAVGYFKQMSMTEFTDFLFLPMMAPVLDHTGLKGRFDFSLDATPDGSTSNPDPRYVFADAVEKHLGLKLVSTKTSIEVLIVDHVEKVPTEN
jgi:uncharacterized protein (TIGR03435 family)